ncbi:MAG: 2-amino-thiazoline-4-carboxylic acid hydrolase [Planctomycetaceae bacterium]|nr:2-amino-thiazoline-4-carboxylic acid hydrolase [Planctomycetaceae bacterium]
MFPTTPIPLPLLQQREVEAKVIAPIYRAFAVEVGEDRARKILTDVILDLARQAGRVSAETGRTLSQFKHIVHKWTEGKALELTVLRDDEAALEFNVTCCQFAEMYHRLGLADLGPLLSCNRDAAMIEGFNSEIGLTRTQTIMEGASHCDFRYRDVKREGTND